ncbi:MAG TPA: TRCF domain-containing protein, partial [Terriglobales bacterium]
LYTQMLDRAVREMKGEVAPEETATQLNLGLNIRIPGEYIAEENQRLRMYKRVAGIETAPQLVDVKSELEDRYGPMPPAVVNLINFAALKLLAVKVGATIIERKRDQISIKFKTNAVIDPEKLMRFVSSQRGAQFTPDGTLKFTLKTMIAADVLAQVQKLLEDLAGVPQAMVS